MRARTKVCILVFISLALVCGLSHGEDGQKQKEAAALAAAKTWLKLIDSGEYLESWKETAGILQTAISRDKWVQIMQSGRKPFGATVSRKLKECRYRTSLPGAPKGEYIVLQFETLFENRKGITVETITPMLGEDKKWRISGYFIK